MRRRDLLAVLGVAAIAWPLAARAQQPDRMRRIGVLMGYAESNPDTQANVAALREALQQLGWAEGRNLRIDNRWPTPTDVVREGTRRATVRSCPAMRTWLPPLRAEPSAT